MDCEQRQFELIICRLGRRLQSTEQCDAEVVIMLWLITKCSPAERGERKAFDNSGVALDQEKTHTCSTCLTRSGVSSV